MQSSLTPAALARDLSLRDLTDPAQGAHALQILVAAAVDALCSAWHCPRRVVRPGPIVAVEDCYDRLGFGRAAITRDQRYTRYVSDTCMLRSHTSAAIPPELRRLAAGGYVADVLLAVPGMVYRRDSIDRLHTGTPHQLDLWRVRRGPPLGPEDLDAMIGRVVGALLPGREHRAVPAAHPYTEHGCQIDVRDGTDWVEIGECGVAAPGIIGAAGLDPGRVSGLAMGLGLDRILMLRKAMPDIRLLTATDPRIADQMQDLSPYREVSHQPAVERDLSIAVAVDETEETLGDRARDLLGADCRAVEAVRVISETHRAALPQIAMDRLGLQPGQKNILLRIVLRDLDRTLTSAEANDLRDRLYLGLHQGSAWAMMAASAVRPEMGERHDRQA